MPGVPIDQLELGMAAELTRTYDERDICTFAALTGYIDPAPVEPAFAEPSLVKGRVAHGLLTASLVSAVIGTKLPGAGSIYLGQSLKFLRPVRVGDSVTARVAVIEIARDRNVVTLQTTCRNQDEERLLEGTAVVRPPGREPPAPSGESATPKADQPAARRAMAAARRPRRHGMLEAQSMTPHPVTIRQHMTPHPVTVSPDATLLEAWALMDGHGIRHLPVTDEGTVTGMLTDADIGRAALPSAPGHQAQGAEVILAFIRVRDVMSRDIVAIRPTAGIGEAGALLVSQKIGALPVVEHGRLVGILTVSDALEALVALVAD